MFFFISINRSLTIRRLPGLTTNGVFTFLPVSSAATDPESYARIVGLSPEAVRIR